MFVPSYDLKNLLKQEIEQVNIVGKINNWINRYSGLIGVTVIIGWTIKVIIYITIIAATIIKEGISATVALVYATCCFVPYTAGRIRRKAKRHRIPTKDYPESIEMNPNESFIYSQAPHQG